MKILLLSDFLPPQMHGITVRCTEWISELRKLGHEVRTISAEKNEDVDIKCASVPLPFNPDVNVALPGLKNLSEIYKYNPDVIHVVSPSWPESFQWMYLYATMMNVPVVTSHHVNLPEYNDKYYKDNFVMNRSMLVLGKMSYYQYPMDQADIICGPSYSSLSYFKETDNYDENKMRVFSTGINREVFNRKKYSEEEISKTRESLKDDFLSVSRFRPSKIICYAGRIAKEKGLNTFFEIAKKEKYIGFIVIGRGPEESHYKNICKSEGIENVLFLGRKEQKELALYYAASDLMLSPSKSETFGFTIIEAMSVGTPVLVPAVPVFKELHGTLSDFLVSEPKDKKKLIKAYSDKIDKIIFVSKEEEVSRQIELIKYCEKFSWKNSAKDMESIYKTAMLHYKPSYIKKLRSLLHFSFQVPTTKALLPLSNYFHRKKVQ